MPFVTSKDGTRIGYSVVGNGPALVLVDGALCWRASGPVRSARRRAQGPLHRLHL